MNNLGGFLRLDDQHLLRFVSAQYHRRTVHIVRLCDTAVFNWKTGETRTLDLPLVRTPASCVKR